MLACCTVLIYWSFRPKQNEEGTRRSYLVVGKSGFKRLEPHLHAHACPKPNLENAEEKYVTGFNKDSIPRVSDSVLQKKFRFSAAGR